MSGELAFGFAIMVGILLRALYELVVVMWRGE